MIDANPSPDDFGDADSILAPCLSVRRTQNEIWIPWTWVRQRLTCGYRMTEDDIPEGGTTDEQRSRSKTAFVGEDVLWVDVGKLWEGDADAGMFDYIVLNMDCGPAGVKGEVCRTPAQCAADQIKLGIARPAEPWEVLAATLTPEPDPPAWARGLEVASMLHGPDDACAVPELREAATWPN